MGYALIYILNSLIDLIVFIVVVNAIVSWLVAFDVLNIRNPQIGRIVRMLDGITRPILRPIQRMMPNLGGIDISPIILFILLQAVKIVIQRVIAGPLISILG